MLDAGGSIAGDRVGGVLVVTRSFGDDDLSAAVIDTPEVRAEVSCAPGVGVLPWVGAAEVSCAPGVGVLPWVGAAGRISSGFWRGSR